MKNYEIIIMADITCTLKSINASIEEFKNVVGKDNIKFTNFVGIREFYNKIQGKTHGYYVHIGYTADRFINEKIEEIIRKNKDILRFVIVQVE